MSRKITKIIIHCSDSSFGSAEIIDGWHREKGWQGIGYHYVIQNGVPAAPHDPVTIFDGRLEDGRPVEQVGAHCEGDNTGSIGICLIGKDNFTDKQFSALGVLIKRLMKAYDISLENIVGHYETVSGRKYGKTCPNFDMVAYRRRLAKFIELT